MIPILSVVTSIKDYIEVVHKLIEYDTVNINYTEFGTVLTYLLISLKNFSSSLIMDMISLFSGDRYFVQSEITNLNWLSNLWSLPVIIPDISSAMVSEISVLNGYFHNTFNFLETPISYGDNNKLVYSFEKFTIGIINSLFLYLPTSTSHIITLRRFLMQGIEAGYIAGLGTIAGNLLWLSSIILGCRFFVIPWLSLDILRYFLGFILIVKYLWDSYNEQKALRPEEDLNQKGDFFLSGSNSKVFLLNFLLSMCEQTGIYPFISNMSISSETTVLESFPVDSYADFYMVHFAYLLGICVGSFSLLHFTCWFWENPAFKLYMWVISTNKIIPSTSFYYKFLNFLFLYLTMITAIASIPYYGLDYALTNPLGYISDDRITQDKMILETSFLGGKASDRNTRRNQGRHGRRERWKRRIRKYRTFDASLFDQGIYDLFTIEDLNYGFDRFWLRRKLRNHRVRFRLFPGPWMRNFKKQLAKPRLESYTGPRFEFFRILFEQVYHPSFHSYEHTNKNKSLIRTRNLITNKERTYNEIQKTLLSSHSEHGFIKQEEQKKRTQAFLSDQFFGKNPKQNSILRKFVRKFDRRLKVAYLNNNPLLSNNNNLLVSNTNEIINSKQSKIYLTRFAQSDSDKLPYNVTPQLQIDAFPSEKVTEKWISKKDLQILNYKTILLKNKQSNDRDPCTSISASFSDNNMDCFLQNNVQFLLHPLKFYLKKEVAFNRKLNYYTPSIFRKFSIENNAPYYRIMMKRYFYNYKPTLRWERTMKMASLRKARRKTKRIPRKMQNNMQIQKYTYNDRDPNQNILSKELDIQTSSFLTSRSSLAREARDERATTLTRSFLSETRTERKAQSDPRIQKSNYNYSVVSKKASRYRSQIYKDVLQHWYYSPFNRILLKLDVDSFIRRQPKAHFLTPKEEKLLHLRRYLISEHYNSLRWYTNMEHYRTMKTRLGSGTKSFSSNMYNQQFIGTFKKIRHLFAITPTITVGGFLNKSKGSSNMEENQQNTILKYEQPLYNELPNQKNNSIVKQLLIHEELLTPLNSFDSRFSPPLWGKEEGAQTTNYKQDQIFYYDDIISNTQNLIRFYFKQASQEHTVYIKQLLFDKNYKKLTHFLLNDPISGALNSSNSTSSNRSSIFTSSFSSSSPFLLASFLCEARTGRGEEARAFPSCAKQGARTRSEGFLREAMIERAEVDKEEATPFLQAKEQGQTQINTNFRSYKLRQFIQNQNTKDVFYMTFLKKWKHRINDQESLKQFIIQHVEKREKQKQIYEKNLIIKLKRLENLLQKAPPILDTPLSVLTRENNQIKDVLLTSGLQKALLDGIQTNHIHTKNFIFNKYYDNNGKIIFQLKKPFSKFKKNIANLNVNELQYFAQPFDFKNTVHNKKKYELNHIKNIQNLNIITDIQMSSKSLLNSYVLSSNIKNHKNNAFISKTKNLIGNVQNTIQIINQLLQKTLYKSLDLQLFKRTSNTLNIKSKKDSLLARSETISRLSGRQSRRTSILSTRSGSGFFAFGANDKGVFLERHARKRLTRRKSKSEFQQFEMVLSNQNHLRKEYKNLNKKRELLGEQPYYMKDRTVRKSVLFDKFTVNNMKTDSVGESNKQVLPSSYGSERAVESLPTGQKEIATLVSRKKRSDSIEKSNFDEKSLLASSSLSQSDTDNKTGFLLSRSKGARNRDVSFDFLGNIKATANQTSISLTKLPRIFLQPFKRKISPQRRSRVRRNRGVFKKRNLTDLIKKDIKNFYSLKKEHKSLTLANIKTTSKLTSGTTFSNKMNSSLYLINNDKQASLVDSKNSWASDYLKQNIVSFPQRPIKQRRSKQRKQRFWKQKRSTFSQKRQKYRKRQRYVVGKIRTLSKQLKRIKNKVEIQNWWWNQYVPSIQASTEALWQIEKDRLIQQKLNELITLDVTNSNHSLYAPLPSRSASVGRSARLSSKGEKTTGSISSKLYGNEGTARNLLSTRPGFGNQAQEGIQIEDKQQLNMNCYSKDTFCPSQKEVVASLYEFDQPNILNKLYSNLFTDPNLNISSSNQTTFIGGAASSLCAFPARHKQDLYDKNQTFNPLNQSNHTKQDGFNAPFLTPNIIIPFYAGWDESLRKFIVTNRMLTRQDAGFEIKELQKVPLSLKQQKKDSTKMTISEFTQSPLKGMNVATTLYWQIPFTTYDPDQFFVLGMDGFSPIGWQKFLFRHSILKTWLSFNSKSIKRLKDEQQVVSSSQQDNIMMVNPNVMSSLINMLSLSQNSLSTYNNKDVQSEGIPYKIGAANLEKTTVFNREAISPEQSPVDLLQSAPHLMKSPLLYGEMAVRKQQNLYKTTNYMIGRSNMFDLKNQSRHLKKRYRRVKKHPRTPVWFPSGPLLNQVLPVHYIYVFYKRSRLPRDRYLKRRLLNTKSIQKSENRNLSINNQSISQGFDLTLRKRLKPRRKYHLKRDLESTNLVLPRRLKFTGPKTINSLFDSSLRVPNSLSNINTIQIQRPLTLQKVNKTIQELVTEQKNIRQKQRRASLDIQGKNLMKGPNIRIKQLKRRVQRQILRTVWRYRPRSGGFVWPGDYLKLETVKAPLLFQKNKQEIQNESSQTEFSKTQIKQETDTFVKKSINIDPNERALLNSKNKRVRSKKRTLMEWQIQPKTYLYEKHNLIVLKKKFEKAFRF